MSVINKNCKEMNKKFASNHFYDIRVPGTGRFARSGKTMLLYFSLRDGNEITFKTHDGRRFKGKVLTNAQGDEICFLFVDGIKYMIEAAKGLECGRRITQETLDNCIVDKEWDEEHQCFVDTKDCGMTLRDFLDKKAVLVKI